ASFIGDINHLPPARLRASGGSFLYRLTPSLELQLPQRADLVLRDGDLVHLFIRPEHLAIAGASDPGRNQVLCRVVQHVYQGTHTLTRVEAAGLGVLQLRIPGGDVIGQAPPGTEIAITIDLAEATVLTEA
ncbi:MAG: TOBE domain-containing protein, partial [Steroidobacteraceae bacterium]